MPAPTTNPPPLTVAASLAAIQGFVLLALAAVEVADLAPDRRSMGVTTAVFFAVYGLLLLVAARALHGRQAWARGPVLLTQLIQIGIAWNIRDAVLPSILLALSAVVVLAGVLHPASIEALGGDVEADEAP